MSEEVRIETRIAVEIVFKQVNDNVHLESTTTFNKHQQNGYKMTTIEFIENSEHGEDAQNDCAVLRSIIGINPKIRNIVSLKLSHCKLSNIPTSFCLLPLRNLDLSYNLLKNVPMCISIGLPDLEEMNLSHNELRTFETEPKCVQKLAILNLEHNSLANLPMWVLSVKCINLVLFYYNNNDLTSLKKSRFTTTRRYKLTNLYLRNCSVMDDDFKVLKTIRTLKTLDIGNTETKNCNGISKLELLFDEAHFTNYIENFSVSNTALCYVPENIINLKYLKHLNVSNNNLSWLPDCIVNLRCLEHLNFSNNKVVRLPHNFNQLENLVDLLGPFNCLALVCIVNMPRLQHVDFYSNEISALDLNFDQLQMADLEQNFIETTRLPVNYTQCLNAFRTKYKDQSIQSRLFNEKEDVYLERNDFNERWSTSSSDSSYDDVHVDFEKDRSIIMNCNIDILDDEEQWDVVMGGKFANISLSDSEWKGDFKVKKKKKYVKRTEYVPDYMFEDAD